MSYTRAQWAAAFLQAVGNPNPNPQVLQWVVGWTLFETAGPPGATYNLLNTTQDAPGATAFNHFGSNNQYSVKNYQSFAQGTQVNARVLANGYYPVLNQALKMNQLAPLGIGGSPSAQVNAELSTWGTGSKAAQIASRLGQGMNDQFPGSTGGTSPGVSVATAKSNTYPKGQCTWWASERYHQLTGYYVPWKGNAADWLTQAKKYQGWNVSGSPSVPSIIVLQPGVQLADHTYGHVAVVESINKDGSVVASNSNWAGHVYPDTVKVTFSVGTGVNFISASSSNQFFDPLQLDVPFSQNQGSDGNLLGDVGDLFNKIGALFGGGEVPPLETALQQVHKTLIDNPGFYGMALAVDEAEQFPGWQNLASGPFDVIGIIRSIGASVGDNFLPSWIRGTLIGLGILIIVLLLAKVILSVGEGALQAIGPLLPLLA